jgi:hypothetical protein
MSHSVDAEAPTTPLELACLAVNSGMGVVTTPTITDVICSKSCADVHNFLLPAKHSPAIERLVF